MEAKRQRVSKQQNAFNAFVTEQVETMIDEELFDKIKNIFDNVATELHIDAPIPLVAENLLFSAISRNTSLHDIQFTNDTIHAGNVDAFNACIQNRSYLSTSHEPAPKTIIYANGKCKDRNKKTFDYLGGCCGVWFYTDNPRNTGIHFPLEYPTVYRIKLYSVLLALNAIKASKDHKNVQIRINSEYCIECLNTHMPEWIRNDWRTGTRRRITNRDIFKPIHKRILYLRSKYGIEVEFALANNSDDFQGNHYATELALKYYIKK